jgi:hypothetical protein
MASQRGYYVNNKWVPAEKTKTGSELLADVAADTTRTLVAVNNNGEYVIVDKNKPINPEEYEWFEDLPSFRYG